MPTLRRLARALRMLASRRRAERDLEDELRFHIEMQASVWMRRGLSAEDAHRRAEQEFGPVTRVREELRAVHAGRAAGVLDGLAADLRFALRSLRRAPGFAIGVAATFALGIGANATMFGIVDRMLLRPPAHVHEPGSILELVATWPRERAPARQKSFPYTAYAAMRDSLHGARLVALSTHEREVAYGRGESARSLRALLVSASYFPLLGVAPVRGRFFTEGDDDPAAASPTVVISHGLWMREFGGARDVVGRTMLLGTRMVEIIGVTPRGFTGEAQGAIDVWLPVAVMAGDYFGSGARWRANAQSTWLRIFVRPRAGVSQARIETEATALNLAAGEPRMQSLNATIDAVPLPESLRSERGASGDVALLLGGVSVLVLLIACANVANLMFARTIARRREVAVRLALGISRARLALQLVVESVLLAMLGGAAALALAWWGGEAARAVLFADVRWVEAPIDLRVLAFTALVTLLVGVLAGAVPAVRASRPQLTAALRAGPREGGGRQAPLRAALLVVQCALSVLLLVGTGLFVRSLHNVTTVPLGMRPDGVLIGSMTLRDVGVAGADAQPIWEAMLERLRQAPGVQRAALAVTVPKWGSLGDRIFVPGLDSLPSPEGGGPFFNAVTPEFFAAMGTRIVRGRPFEERDDSGAEPVAIVNETLARMAWPGENPVGQCIRIGEPTAACTRVVGVSENSRRQNWIEDEIFHVHLPLAQAPAWMSTRVLVVRVAEHDVSRMIGQVRLVMQSAAPDLPYANVRPLLALYEGELRPWRLGATMFGAFAVLALALAAVGLYGVVSFGVVQRVHEIGVRMALGARVSQVVGLVMRQGIGVAAVGLLVGAALAVALGRLVEELLFRVSPRDPVTFTVVALALLVVAVAACVVPAWRAARVDPAAALRAE